VAWDTPAAPLATALLAAMAALHPTAAHPLLLMVHPTGHLTAPPMQLLTRPQVAMAATVHPTGHQPQHLTAVVQAAMVARQAMARAPAMVVPQLAAMVAREGMVGRVEAMVGQLPVAAGMVVTGPLAVQPAEVLAATVEVLRPPPQLLLAAQCGRQ